jgi:hypothetical protein
LTLSSNNGSGIKQHVAAHACFITDDNSKKVQAGGEDLLAAVNLYTYFDLTTVDQPVCGIGVTADLYIIADHGSKKAVLVGNIAAVQQKNLAKFSAMTDHTSLAGHDMPPDISP